MKDEVVLHYKHLLLAVWIIFGVIWTILLR